MGRFDSEISISVVVVNWNRRNLLAACLESLRVQTATDFELVVVDNGSTDGSQALVREFAQRLSVRVQLIENKDNRGFCEANNQGIAVARGRFIALLNNDAEADPDWLRSLHSALADRPGVGMAASKILQWDDPRRIDKVGHLIYPDGQNRGRGTGEVDLGQYDQDEDVAWPDGCAAMYRKEMLDEIGGFDEDLFAYADDAELGLRARIAGWSCVYVPRAVVRHHRGSTLGALSSRRIILIERNRVLLAAKLFPWNLLWLNGAYYLARLAAGAVAVMRRRGEASKAAGAGGKLRLALALIQGDLQAIPRIPGMLRKRREMKKISKLSPSEVRALILKYRIPLKDLTEMA